MTAATSDQSSSLLTTKRRDLLALDTQKKSLQSEAEAIVSELTAQLPDGGPPIGIDTPLIDSEGYPRGDIDIYRARTLRKRFKEIQTDHKALEKKIDLGLMEIAALTKSSSVEQQSKSKPGSSSISNATDADDEKEKMARLAPKPKPKFDPKTGKWVVKSWDGSVAGVENGEMRSFEDLSSTSTAALASIAINAGGGRNVDGGTSASEGNRQTSSASQQHHQQQVSFQEESTTPFAIIDEVSPNSPAHEAGLKKGDVLLRFGSVHSRNHRDFSAIAELIPLSASQDKSISVSIRRKTVELGGAAEVIRTEKMELRPRTWSGRGLLGCHIQPYSE